jgi:signal transduction histidine kinase/ActR/RegA family two-component response regulator
MFDANGHIEAMVELTLDITERVRAVEDLKKIKNEQDDLINERTRDLMILNEQLKQEVNVRKKQEAKLRKQKDYIQQLAMEVTSAEDRERQRLASILHDGLQQTLAYLKLQMSTLFSDDKNSENVDHLIGIINDCLGRCRDLAHEMNPIIIKNKDFKSALEWLCLQMKNRYGLKVALQTSSDLKIQSTALLSMLIRSIRELLFNIVKHSGDKNAFVEVMADRDWIQIAVKDTGRGCDLDILKNKQNTGEVFGLFDIEDRIQFIGGNVHVVSKLGRGFTVTLDVPRDVILPSKRRQKVYPQVMLTEMQPATTTDALDPDLDTTSIRVLIVDDHELFREGLSKMLQGQEGISVVGRAADGREAIQLALQLNPDVILMDLSMPVLDGIKATAQIHAQLPNIKIIGLTIHEEPSAFQAMLDSGASACLSKTSSPRELVKSIRFPKNEHSRN